MDAMVETSQERAYRQARFLLVLRSDGEPEIEKRKREFRAKALALGVPVFEEMANAGQALAALQSYERFMDKRSA